MAFFEKLKQSLTKTGGMIAGLFSGDAVNDEFYEELEEALIVADVGMDATEKLLDRLRAHIAEKKITARDEAKTELKAVLAEAMQPDTPFLTDAGKAAILIVGVNGVGKTTSIGKIAHYYKNMGRDVMLSAADTFRAAAAEQLTVWAERAGVPIVKHGEGADPAAVVFDSIASFKAKGRDMLIIDTAGRLHNKKNLMAELEKIRRVVGRELPDAPTEVLMVLDATTGQNGIAQAEAFGESAGLTGIILTKLDGTAKGGIAVAVKEQLRIPVRFVGVGEGIEDMQPFNAEEFAEALVG